VNIEDDPILLAEVTELVQPGIGIFMSSLATTIMMMVPNEPRDIVEWAAEYLIVPSEVSERSGPLEMPQFQASIVRLAQLPTTRQISHQKPTRIGSSFMSAVEIIYFAAWEGWPVIYYERSDDAAQGFHDKVLYPILSSSPKLAHLLRPRTKAGIQDAWSDIILKNGAAIQLRSASNQSSFRAIKGAKIFCDEVSSPEWQDRAKKTLAEGNKLTNAKRRSQQYAAPLMHAGSTPTNIGSCLISQQYALSDKRHYKMPCIRCGESIAFEPDVRMAAGRNVPNGGGMRYLTGPKGDIADTWYECQECGGHIEEHEKIAMLEKGDWVARNPYGEKGHIGLYNWAAHSTDPQSAWATICSEHRKAVVDPSEWISFTQTILCMPYDPSPIADLDPSALEARAETWYAGKLETGAKVQVPYWAEMLVCGGDIQEGTDTDSTKKPRYEFSVVAVGINGRHAVIRHEIIDSRVLFDEFSKTWQKIPVEPFTAASCDLVWDFIGQDWLTEDGRRLKIRRTFLDTSFRSEDAEKFCRLPMSKNLKIMAIKGSSTEWGNKVAGVLPQKVTSVSKARKAQYIEIGTRVIKDTLAQRLAIPSPGAQSYVFSADLPREYFEGLLAEQLVEVRPGIKRWKRINRKNTGEPWDCLIYAYAAERYEIRKLGAKSRLALLIDTITPEAAEDTLMLQAEIAVAKATNAEARIAGVASVPEIENAAGVETAAPIAEPALNAACPIVQPAPETAAKPPRFTIAPRPQPRGAVPVDEANPEKRTVVERAKARAGKQGLRW
jgi:phage terminase large subunit GpA-like protein